MKTKPNRRSPKPEIIRFVQLVPSDDLNTPMFAIDSKGRCWQHPARGAWSLCSIASFGHMTPGFQFEPNRGRR